MEIQSVDCSRQDIVANFLRKNEFPPSRKPKILCINYADDRYGRAFSVWQKVNSQSAYLFGADQVIEYSQNDLPQWFYEKNKLILDQKKIAGRGLWKGFIIKDALSKVQDGDYVFYVDSGIFYVHAIQALIDAMENEKTDVMPMSSSYSWIDKIMCKRDALILMDCDKEEYINTPQRESGYIILKKTPRSVALIEEFIVYMQDPRINTDIPNQLGKENYEGFKRNFEDQTVWSLLTKKRGYKAFREATQRRVNITTKLFPKDVLDRSTYPIMFYLHRCSLMQKQLEPRLIKQFLYIAKKYKAETLPEEFKSALTYQVAEYIKQYGTESFKIFSAFNLPPPEEILASYRELNYPEIPSFKEAVEKFLAQSSM